MTTPQEIMQAALKEGRKALLEHEAKKLVRSAGISVPKFEIVALNDEKALLNAAEKLGYPIAVKALSPDILHKTEAGAIMLDIKNKIELASAVRQITNNISQRLPGAVVLHYLLEKMMPPGPELLIGGLRDDQFGPAIAFGLGGIWTETLKDAVFGILPLSRGEMIDMIDETRAGLFFKEFRGAQPLDREPVLSVMQAVSRILTEYAEIREIDLNPVRVYARGAAALDARILLKA
ncbi:MAG TPA: acetate--CoA ligase family protein [Nitrospirota bacterium]|nr:acetate--CoA ligase family protein [Nitrospirota bacterium]